MIDIKERILTILGDCFDEYGVDDYGLMAAAVVHQLGLRYQYESGRVMYNVKPAACKPNGNWKIRIVSPHEIYKEDDEAL